MFENFDFRNLLLMAVPVLLALTVHEYAHALAAHKLGDDTAKNEGRLTLNPLAHLDPVGTVVLFLSQMFGWAKPVPFNPARLKNPARDSVLIAVAGPASNIITAVAVTVFLKLALTFGFFRLLPTPVVEDLIQIIYLAIMVNVGIGVFNMLPVPPLDGFKVVSYFLPRQWVVASYQYSMVFFGVFLVLIATGTLSKIVGPVVRQLQQAIFLTIMNL